MKSRLVLATLLLAGIGLIVHSSALGADSSSCPRNAANVRPLSQSNYQATRRTARRRTWTMREQPSRGSGYRASGVARTFKWGTHEFRF